jgi:hypothetical protein
MRILALTVSDRLFFSGTLAAVNSLLHYTRDWPADWQLDIAVVSSGHYNQALTEQQRELLKHERIRVYAHEFFQAPQRVPGAWQLKAYAAHDLSCEYDFLVGFDSDLVFASDVRDVIAQCQADGKFRGGKDGNGVRYGKEYAPYGIAAGETGPYMSTSCYFCPLTPENREILADWALKTNQAAYGPQAEKRYVGHGDQGVLNSVIFARTRSQNVELLPNETWSQHWRYESDVVAWDGAQLINYTARKLPMRALHCGGSDKFWAAAHAEKRLEKGQSQRWGYAHFLRFLHFGALSVWKRDPLQYIPAEQQHLFRDALNYWPLMFALAPEVADCWGELSPAWLSRAIEAGNIHRMMSLHADGSGSMNQYISLARRVKHGGTLVEVGSYLGGSAVTVAAATRDRQLRVISVESFAGNLNNMVDGHPLPSINSYVRQVKTTFPFLNVDAVPLPGELAVSQFADGSLDIVFIDGDHSTPAVLRDIDVWWPKVAPGGILAGDDYDWKTVAEAVAQRFPTAEHQSCVWWTQK